MNRRFSLGLLTVLLICPTAKGALSDADRVWMQETLSDWQTVAKTEFRLGEGVMPWVIFFDSEFVWNVRPEQAVMEELYGTEATRETLENGSSSFEATGYAHGGMVQLPEGGEIPPQLILFASVYGEGKKPYFVFAMPEIWRATPRHAGEEDLDALITGVFVHEITHTQQAGTLGKRIDALVAEHGLDDDEINDDMIQNRYGEVEAHQALFDRERNLYFEAVAADSDEECRRIARQALQATRERQAQWYRGDDAFYAEFEDLFLIFEGSANWGAYRALVRSGLSEELALPTLRRGGRWWSQDEGLALYLLLERLGAPWREDAFSEQPGSVFGLLESQLAGGD